MLTNKRIFDLSVCIIFICLVFIPMVFIAIMIFFTSKGPIFFWSNRVGLNNTFFQMPKFRTMLLNTPVVASHLIKNSNNLLSPIGGFLRKFSLDELPQLFSIMKGDMSFVGPRPALYNQYNLIEMRKTKGIHNLTPGLTGWAQVSGFRGKNPSSINMKKRMEHDLWYMNNWSIWLDIFIVLKTFYIIFKKPIK